MLEPVALDAPLMCEGFEVLLDCPEGPDYQALSDCMAEADLLSLPEMPPNESTCGLPESFGRSDEGRCLERRSAILWKVAWFPPVFTGEGLNNMA
jgi:hypothetical protein